MFTVMFAVSRSVGWMTHWCEMMNESHRKISRPQQLFVGEKEREYEDIEDRKHKYSHIKETPKLNKLTSLMKV